MNSGKPRTEQAEVSHRILQSHTTRYALAIVAVILAGLLRYLLSGFFGERAAYITFYPAVTVAALLGGFGPGVVATCLSTCIAAFWILPHVGELMVSPCSSPSGV
jgi:K+-sensing histidine kinase KdpD